MSSRPERCVSARQIQPGPGELWDLTATPGHGRPRDERHEVRQVHRATDAHELRLEELPPPETARTLIVAQFSGSGGMKHIIIVPAAVRNTQALLRIAGSSSIPGGRLWMMT
jgi:hypothetical protein